MKRFLLLFSVLVFMITFSIEGFALFDTHGFSAAGIGRGNAMAAVVNDSSATFYNMAGLGKNGGVSGKKEKAGDKGGEAAGSPVQMSIGYMYDYPMFDIAIGPVGGREVIMDQDLDSSSVVIGVAIDLNLFYEITKFTNGYLSSARFGVGIGLGIDGKWGKWNDPDPSLTVAKINSLDSRTHNFLRYGREASRPLILFGLGLGFWKDSIGVGIGSSAIIAGKGAIRVTDFAIGPESEPFMHEAKIDVKIKPAPVYGIYLSPGKIAPILKGLELGASYRNELTLDFDISDMSASTSLAGITLELSLIMSEYFSPKIYSVGAAYTPPLLSRLTFSADLEMQKWSMRSLAGARTDYWIRKMQTSSNPNDAISYKLPVFRDILIPKFGVSYKIDRVPIVDSLNLLAGYYQQPAFLDNWENSTGVFNILDNNKEVYSMGIELFLPKLSGMSSRVQLNLAFQYQIFEERDVLKNMISNSSTDQDADYWYNYNPNYSYGGTSFLIMAEVVMKW